MESQIWPALAKQPKAVRATAFSMSASSKMMVGPLPPSSSSIGLPAARWATTWPVRLEPVRPMATMPGWPATSSPTSAGSPRTRLRAPSGTPASRKQVIRCDAEIGVHSEGFHTIALPAAKPADRYSLGIATGKFQGVRIPYTPRGWRIVSTRLAGSDEGMTAVSRRLIASAASRNISAATSTSGNASATYGLPCSSETWRAISSFRCSSSSATRWQSRARSNTVIAARRRWAASAASTAVPTSLRVPCATRPISSPVAGERSSTGSRSPSVQSPPMHSATRVNSFMSAALVPG